MDVLILRADEPSAALAMEKELSGVMIVLIIGGGVLIFCMLFIFAKRQIMRFAIRQRRGPHAPVGHDAKKSIKREIDRRLDCIQKISHEPQLITDYDSRFIIAPDKVLPPLYYRLKAVDDIKNLENEIFKQIGSQRQPHDSLRGFLLSTLAAPLNGTGQRVIQQFCDCYEHSRHDPNEFGSEEYETYRHLFLKLHNAAKMLKSFSSRKSSPSRTPIKKLIKVQSLLDPSRLRPPPLKDSDGYVIGQHRFSNIQPNITLAMQNEEIHQRVIVSTAPHHHHRTEQDNAILNNLQYEKRADSIVV